MISKFSTSIYHMTVQVRKMQRNKTEGIGLFQNFFGGVGGGVALRLGM